LKFSQHDIDRRRFLKLGLASGAAAGFGGWLRPASALAYGAQGALYRSLVPEGATPAAKGIDSGWLASLRLREPAEPAFTKAANQLRYIGMPVGGIGCGTLYLGGDGRLWLWDVWHKGGVGIRPRSRTYQHPNGTSASHNCQNGANYFAPIDVWATNPPADEKPFPFDQGFVLRAERDGVASLHTLDHHGFADISFRGSYPLAKVTYADPACPLDVELTSHPVFIPLNTPDSALPATVMEYSLHNPGSLPVEFVLLGWMQNPVFLDSGLPAGLERVNRLRPGTGHAFLECGSAGTAATPFAYASDYTVFASFEGSNYDDWTTTGTAFGNAPVTVPPPTHANADLRDVRGVGNQIVNSYLATGGSDVPTGTLTSPAFTVTKGYIHFLLGGGSVPGIQVRLLDAADSSQLRIATNASNSSTMKWRTWDVRDLAGRSVKIVVEDLSGGVWGQLDFDHVCFSDKALAPEYVVFDDFERTTYAPWTTTGTAFGSGPIPITAIPAYQGNVNGLGNRVVNSHASAPGGSISEKDAKTGTLVSPAFTVTHGYLHFLQGGGSYTNETRVRLLRASDGAQLRIQTGNDNNAMTWRTWDLRDLRGQSVYLSVEDLRTGGWGNVGVDQFVFSTNPAAPPATTDVGNLVDRGTIGIAEMGTDTGRVSAADNLSAAFPWLPGKSADTGGIGRTLTLAPGATATVRFVVTWHFANLPAGLPGNRREYANRFADAFAVADYLATDWERLVGDTRAWIDTWKDSSLPHWFLDRCLSTAATLATANCFWFTTGRFYGNEGVNCCAGTCGHVWYYAQTIARLFPDLERGMRQNVDLNSAVALTASGAVKFRGEYNSDWAWDGQCGVVLRCYREHLASADSTFLDTNWPNIKKVLDFLIAEDANNDGVSEARQHNTLDADWYGRVPEHIGLYAAALRAGREMAAALGDATYAAICESLAAAAMARMAERFVSGGDYGEGYFVQKMAANAGQLGHAEGCYIDQVMGELYARLTGLARVTDAAQCRAALRSIWRFAYSHDLTNLLSSTAIRQGRIYQMAGEAGLLICTFPNDGNQWAGAWQSMYFAECMTGFEYQVGAHCLAEGLLDEGLTIVRAIYDRYHPDKRNPFNEIECSDHYARAMSSYACLLGVSGFRHSGPDGMLAFAPTLNPDSFRSAFTTAQGWGTYQRSRQGARITETVTLKHGSLRLRRFESSVPEGTQGVLAQATLNGNLTTATFTLDGNTLGCALPADLSLAPGDVFQVTVFSSILPAATDTDGDGLTDLEETSGIDDAVNTPGHDPRGHVTDPGQPDTDHDGTGDGTEARLGTSPVNPGEWFHAALSEDALGRPTLSWPSTTGITFTIQRGSDLSGWQDIASGYAGQAGLTTFTDPAPLPAPPRVFYRVALDAP
jgi:uncharacterized protein (DUF608 family)